MCGFGYYTCFSGYGYNANYYAYQNQLVNSFSWYSLGYSLGRQACGGYRGYYNPTAYYSFGFGGYNPFLAYNCGYYNPTAQVCYNPYSMSNTQVLTYSC